MMSTKSMAKRYLIELTEAEINVAYSLLEVTYTSGDYVANFGDSTRPDRKTSAANAALERVVAKLEAVKPTTYVPLRLTRAEAKALSKAVDNTLSDGEFVKDWCDSASERAAMMRAWEKLNTAVGC